MKESLHDFCVRERRQDLLEQWVADTNLSLTLTVIFRDSKHKVWWRCEKGYDY